MSLLSAARALWFLPNIAQLSARVPTCRRLDALTRPRHTALDPVAPPLLKTDASVIVVVTELKSARWADFVGAAAVRVPRLFGKVRKPANRTSKRYSHSCTLMGMGKVFQVADQSMSDCSA